MGPCFRRDDTTVGAEALPQPKRSASTRRRRCWCARHADCIERCPLSGVNRAGTDEFRAYPETLTINRMALGKAAGGPNEPPEARPLGTATDRKLFNIVQLITRPKLPRLYSKCFDFSRLSWRSIGWRY